MLPERWSQVAPGDKLKTGDKAVRLVPNGRCQVISEPAMVARLPGRPKEPIAGAAGFSAAAWPAVAASKPTPKPMLKLKANARSKTE